jgi:hypothetical protein
MKDLKGQTRVTLHEAELLKQFGYSKQFNAYYNFEKKLTILSDNIELMDLREDEYPAPKLDDVIEWLLFTFNIHCDIALDLTLDMYTCEVYNIKDYSYLDKEDEEEDPVVFNTYNKAVHNAISEAFKLLKTN